MLVNKGYAEGDVVSFKFVNGDEVVAKIVEKTDTGFVISKPCTVVPSAKGLMLIQSLYAAELNNIEVNAMHVMMHAAVIQEMADHYLQTTTGIQTVTKGSIIT
jgi:hypothetical protein